MTKTALSLIALMVAVAPIPASAQVACPPEVQAAKSALKTRQDAMAKASPPRTPAGARTPEAAPRGQSVEAPREEPVQAPRGQSVEAPREEPVQAPRGQSVQAPREEPVQAPRGQSVQAPREEPVQAPRGASAQAPRAPAGAQEQDARGAASPGSAMKLDQAAQLVKDAEAACATNDMTRASASAKAALEVLKSLE
jgi:hypothetical protein